MNRPSIYDYLDYRVFLKNMFLYKKETTASFSYRCFSRLAGFASPNFLKLVIDGQRNLTNTSIAKISKGFKLKKPEREFFENLVFMNQAADHSEQNHYYRKLISLRGQGNIKKLEKAQYEYFSKWYFPVIRELVMFGDRRQTPEQIAEKLTPSVKVKDVEIALKQLQRLELIRKDEAGRWEQADTILSTGPEVKSLLITNFHREMIRLAEKSLTEYPAKERDITALTLSISQKRLAELKQKIAAFRKEILNEFTSDNISDQVIQINIQAFPLTKSKNKGDNS